MTARNPANPVALRLAQTTPVSYRAALAILDDWDGDERMARFAIQVWCTGAGYPSGSHMRAMAAQYAAKNGGRCDR